MPRCRAHAERHLHSWGQRDDGLPPQTADAADDNASSVSVVSGAKPAASVTSPVASGSGKVGKKRRLTSEGRMVKPTEALLQKQRKACERQENGQDVNRQMQLTHAL